MNKIILDQLIRSDLFKGVEPAIPETVFMQIRTKLLCYKKGSLVMHRGEQINDLLVLVRGQLSAEIHSMQGKNLRIEVLKAPGPIAAGILFSTNNRLPVSLYAVEDADILHIPKEAVFRLCALSRTFMGNYFHEMGEKIVFLAEKIRLFQFNTIKQKIAGYLLGLAKQGEPEPLSIRLPYNREILSELMGVTRPALSREFSILTSAGLIKTNGRLVYIPDRKALAALLTDV